jgi:hypothetical protein
VTRVRRVLMVAAAAIGVTVPGHASTARTGLIAFERNYSIYVVEPDGSGLRLLAKKFGREPGEGDGYLFAPSFTPDGSHITYVNGIRTTHQDVVVRPSAGGRPNLYPVDGYLLSGALSFSPDGRFAVVSRLGDPPPHAGIFKASTTKPNDEIQLTGTPPRRGTYDSSPDWSPDGRRIAFWRESRSKPPRLMVFTRPARSVSLSSVSGPTGHQTGDSSRSLGRMAMFVAPTGVRRAGWSRFESQDVDFSPDGQRVAFEAGGALWVASIDGGSKIRIAGGASGGLDWG